MEVVAAVIGVVGVVVGAGLARWAARQQSREERTVRRQDLLRAERKEDYRALLWHAERCFHLFQELDQHEEDAAERGQKKADADAFYDEHVTTRLRMVQITGTKDVSDAARELRKKLNVLRYLVRNERPLDRKDQNAYRAARREFVRQVAKDLGHQRAAEAQ
jgi:hypothetical protein